MVDTSNAIARTRQRLEEELAQLQARRSELAAELGDRDAVGDRADHADLLEQADDVAWLDDRIAEITGLLARGGCLNRRPAGCRMAPRSRSASMMEKFRRCGSSPFRRGHRGRRHRCRDPRQPTRPCPRGQQGG